LRQAQLREHFFDNRGPYFRGLKEQAADLQRIALRIIQSTESTDRIIERSAPELSLPQTNDIPNFVRTLRSRVRPDNVNDYMALVKSEILPAAKKSA